MSLDVGRELRNARLARRLTLPEVAEFTRIRASLIDAIERNDFDACGGDVFARGHVRAIATALDIDPQPLLEAMGANTAPTTLAAVEPESLDIWELRSRAYVPSEARTWAAIAITALAIVIGLIWHARANDVPPQLDPQLLPSVSSSAIATVTPEATPTATPDSTSATADPGPTTTAEPTATAKPTTTAKPTPSATGPAETVLSGGIVLQIDCVDTSWVRVTDANGTVFEATMRAGDSHAISSDTDLTLRIGNAAGIALTVNGLDYGTLGAPGEVYAQTFRIG